MFWIQGSIYQPEIEYQPIDPPDPAIEGFMAIHAKILAVIEKAYGTETTKEKEYDTPSDLDISHSDYVGLRAHQK